MSQQTVFPVIGHMTCQVLGKSSNTCTSKQAPLATSSLPVKLELSSATDFQYMDVGAVSCLGGHCVLPFLFGSFLSFTVCSSFALTLPLQNWS